MMAHKKLSFQSWILGGCLLVVVITMMPVAWLSQSFMRSQMESRMQDSLQRELFLLREVVSHRFDPQRPTAHSDAVTKRLSELLPGTRITLIAADGRVLGDSSVAAAEVPDMENHRDRPEVGQALRQGSGLSIRYSATIGHDLMYAALRMDQRGGNRLVIRVSLPLSKVDAAAAEVRNRVLMAVLAGILISILVSWLVSRSISRPVSNLTQAASAIAGGDLSLRSGQYPSRELSDLSLAFNSMATNLQSKIEDAVSQRNRLEATLSGMVEGVLLVDQGGKILLANRAVQDILQMSFSVGSHIAESIRNPELIEVLTQVRQQGTTVSRAMTTHKAPTRHLEVEAVRLHGHGAEHEVLAVLHDVTERKRTDEMRRDFVANVSHELRTPLTAIRGSAETLLDGALEDPKYSRHFVEMIGRHTIRLEALSRDLLELSRLESANGASKWEEIDCAEFADSVLDTVGELAKSKEVELHRTLPTFKAAFHGDRRQLEEAVINLLDNAIKYTEPEGKVTLGVHLHAQETHLEVSDTGLGISAEHLPRIFERFYRVDQDRSRSMGGTGLGLAIVKHVVLVHEGKVEVTSTPGKGSTFRIILPN